MQPLAVTLWPSGLVTVTFCDPVASAVMFSVTWVGLLYVTLLTIAPDPAAAPTGLEVATLPTLARDLVNAREVIRILADEVRAARDAATQTAAALQETPAKVDALDARLKAWEGLSFVDRLLGRKPKPPST